MQTPPIVDVPVSDPFVPFAEHCNFMCGEHLARMIADQFGVEPHVALQVMAGLPETLAALLNSPHGWVIIAGYVTDQLGAAPAPLAISVH